MAGKQVDAHVQQDSSPSGRITVDQPDSDDSLLESLGYRQEFRREFTRWSTLSYAIPILGVLGSARVPLWLPEGRPRRFGPGSRDLSSRYVSPYQAGRTFLTKLPGSQALHTRLLKWEGGTFAYAPTAEVIVAVCIAVLICLGILYHDGLLSSPLGNPAAQVFMNAGGRAGGLAMLFWVILVQFFTGISAMLSDTRTCFALARDEALPFHSYTQTPLFSVWAVVIFCCLLNLIALGSTQTINGIFGVTTPAMDLSGDLAIAAFIALFALTWWYLEAKERNEMRNAEHYSS
ncbi:hypothetical protein DL767_003811 [Monosporascus sp. MG133]|nr:hypothetical protein DL767_003811 [Monosporascus sp. MG133]